MMDRIEILCEKLTLEVENLYIDRITENDASYYFYLSDQYGNVFDMLPICLDKETGDEIFVSLDYDPSGTVCAVPEKYRTYKSLIIDKLSKLLTEDEVHDIEPHQISIAVNALFLEGYLKAELSSLFAICNCLVSLVLSICDEDEQNSFFKLVNNPVVDEFLSCSFEEKLQWSKDYCFVPEFMGRFLTLTDKMLRIALDYDKTGELQRDVYGETRDNIRIAAEDCKKGIAETDDPFCEKTALEQKLDWVMQQVEMEMAYCESRTKELSQRMTDAKSETDSKFDGAEDFWGEFPPFLADSVDWGSEE